MSVLLFIFISAARVEDWLRAQSAMDIEILHKKELETQILNQRCSIELRQQWPPKSCFAWLQSVELGQIQKKQLEFFFQQRCVLATQQLRAIDPRAIDIAKIKNGPCFEALKQSYLDWRYRARQTAELPELSRIVKIGREFEVDTGHARKKYPKSRRLPNYR